MRVLVVEDEEPLGEVFRGFLTELGHQAVVVRSAEAAPRVPPPGRPGPIEVIALVARAERDSVALSFVYLVNAEAKRLGDIVQRLQQS